jgi:hypothetical protein
MHYKISLILLLATFTVSAQRNKAPRMAPLYDAGYYVSTKNDTIRGEVQTNVDDPTSVYREFAFKARAGKKPVVFNFKKAKAYGFGNRNFEAIDVDGVKIFAERLAKGRLTFYEYQYMGKIDGYDAIESAYLICDAHAEGEDRDLGQPRKISQRFYKKALKPYMKDQPMIWSDLDKFHFDEKQVLNAINEFNNYYPVSRN